MEGGKINIPDMQKLFLRLEMLILLSRTFNWFSVYALILKDLLFKTDEILKLTKLDIKSSELHSVLDILNFPWKTSLILTEEPFFGELMLYLSHCQEGH